MLVLLACSSPRLATPDLRRRALHSPDGSRSPHRPVGAVDRRGDNSPRGHECSRRSADRAALASASSRNSAAERKLRGLGVRRTGGHDDRELHALAMRLRPAQATTATRTINSTRIVPRTTSTPVPDRVRAAPLRRATVTTATRPGDRLQAANRVGANREPRGVAIYMTFACDRMPAGHRLPGALTADSVGSTPRGSRSPTSRARARRPGQRIAPCDPGEPLEGEKSVSFAVRDGAAESRRSAWWSTANVARAPTRIH